MEVQERVGECNRCGNCCKEGGAALHSEDLDLVRSGKIPFAHLVTVRKGELSIVPGIQKTAEIVSEEFIKLGGVGKSWCCRYYIEREGKGGCGIYEFRPLACRTLQCWDTSAIERIIGKNLLHRRDALFDSHPLLTAITQHDEEFSCNYCTSELHNALSSGVSLPSAQKREVERLIQGDLNFRGNIVEKYNISLGEELFFFGRPLFQVLAPLGIKVLSRAGGRGVIVRWE